MQLKTLARPSHTPIRNPILRRRSPASIFVNSQFLSKRLHRSISSPSIRLSPAKNGLSRLVTACISSHSHEFVEDNLETATESDGNVDTVSSSEEVVPEVVRSKREELANQSIWSQMKEIMMFSGPATGLWVCGPLMSLISTAVIGQGSSTELAALGRFLCWKFLRVLDWMFDCWRNVGKKSKYNYILNISAWMFSTLNTIELVRLRCIYCVSVFCSNLTGNKNLRWIILLRSNAFS